MGTNDNRAGSVACHVLPWAIVQGRLCYYLELLCSDDGKTAKLRLFGDSLDLAQHGDKGKDRKKTAVQALLRNSAGVFGTEQEWHGALSNLCAAYDQQDHGEAPDHETQFLRKQVERAVGSDVARDCVEMQTLRAVQQDAELWNGSVRRCAHRVTVPYHDQRTHELTLYTAPVPRFVTVDGIVLDTLRIAPSTAPPLAFSRSDFESSIVRNYYGSTTLDKQQQHSVQPEQVWEPCTLFSMRKYGTVFPPPQVIPPADRVVRPPAQEPREDASRRYKTAAIVPVEAAEIVAAVRQYDLREKIGGVSGGGLSLQLLGAKIVVDAASAFLLQHIVGLDTDHAHKQQQQQQQQQQLLQQSPARMVEHHAATVVPLYEQLLRTPRACLSDRKAPTVRVMTNQEEKDALERFVHDELSSAFAKLAVRQQQQQREQA
jgi:hypothetical protein